MQESFRTFTGTGLYVQDLIVDEQCRGVGAGTLLFRAVAGLALRLGGDRLFWESEEDNRAGNAFYSNTIGAEQVRGQLSWKLAGQAC